MSSYSKQSIHHRWILFFAVFFLWQCAEKTSEYYVKEGIEFTNQQNYPQARNSFQLAVEKDPKNPQAYYGLGGILNFYKEHENAEQAFKKALELDPTYYDAYYSLGYSYEKMGRDAEAQENFKKFKELKDKMEKLLQ